MKHAVYKQRRAEVAALVDNAHAHNKQRTAEIDRLYENANAAEKSLYDDSQVIVDVSGRGRVIIRAEHIALVLSGATIPNRMQEEDLPLKHVTLAELAFAMVMKVRHTAWLAGDIDEISTDVDSALVAQICALTLRGIHPNT